MPFIYHDPHTVLNPKKFIMRIDVLYDGGADGFSLATLDWEGTEHMGMRWNVAFKEQSQTDKQDGKAICHGSPAQNDIPSWFILPRELFNPALFDKESRMFMDIAAKWAQGNTRELEPAETVFDRRAREYQEKFMDVSLYHDTLDVFCNAIEKDNADVLELACGPGNITSYLMQKRADFKILATDLAPNMVELARKGNPGAEFQLLDCRNIGSIGKKFDAIMCGFGLPYLSVSETKKLISDAAAVLHPGGAIYLSAMEEDEQNRSGIKTSSYGDKLYMHYHRADDIAKSLEQNGFSIKDLRFLHYSAGDGTATTDFVIIAEMAG